MKPKSLDELISKHAEEFADQVRAAAAIADKEEEIRIEVEKQLAFVQREAGVKLQGKHEFTVASGRVDSVYNCVIVEYKNPSSPGARIGPGANSPGAKKVVEQIKSRFYDLRSKETLNTLFGVGCDGNHFIFVRYYNDKWQVQDPVEVNKHSAERFLWALFNLGTRGKRFEPDYLAGDFGSSEGSVASAGIKILYDAISTTTNPKAETFFNQWKILFGEVCGYDVDNPSDKIKKLAAFYGVPSKGVKPAEMLFAVHTYYALFMKLLAGEVIGHFHKLPSLIGKMIAAPSAAKLKAELAELEAGGIFRHLGITNFLEGDLFAWYLPAWSDDIEELVRKMTARLDQYNPGTLAEEPAESRDMLKKLYQQLFPKSVRHDLGEYYTPDWLADHVLNELGYAGDPDKRILDPACGSGTFLVMAITRIRAWYEQNREALQYDEGELCKRILANVVGFDLNPLAVMAARTNYLIAIRDLVTHVDKVEIPVYLCDSILTPSTYGGLFAGSTTAAKELKTSAATFLVPTEIATNADDVAKYAEQLEFCVRNGYEPKEFIQRCQDEGLPITLENLHTDLYRELVELDKANKNGVWARIIKNAFAPLFLGKVDYVAGNPPWINWRHLPPDYRESLAPLWQHYGLFPHEGLRARLGAGMDDLSVLMTYVCGDVYLSARGRLGFVITQTLFQSAGGGQGFRTFRLPKSRFFKVESVHDFSAFQPFEGATNRTATFTFAISDRATTFPVSYTKIKLLCSPSELVEYSNYSELPLQKDRFEATPIGSDLTSPWAVIHPGMSTAISKVAGQSPYDARIGAHSGGASGVYWVDLQRRDRRTALIANCWDAGRNKYQQVTASVEAELVRPLIRGRDVQRWSANASVAIVMPYVPENDGKAISESAMRREYPKTYEYFQNFRAAMLKRPHYLQHFKAANAPYWSMYNVGNYSFAPARVVWREQTSSFRCAVVENRDDEIPIAEHKLIVVPCSEPDEAHYLAALLNSAPARYLIDAYVVKVQISTHVLDNIAISAFSPKSKAHAELARLSKLCHTLAAENSAVKLQEAEKAVDDAAQRYWNLTGAELRDMRRYIGTVEVSVTADDEEV